MDNLPVIKEETEVILNNAKDDIIIENTIYEALDQQPFIANMLQILQIKWASDLPAAAGICYDPKSKSFQMFLNKEIIKTMSTQERCAVFFHEIYHVLHKHLTSVAPHLYMQSPEDRMKWNFAMDMAINQYIPNLPQWALQPSQFKDKAGQTLKLEMPFEYYHEAIDWDKVIPPNNCPVHGKGSKSQGGPGDKNKDNGDKQEGQGEGQGEKQPGEGPGEPQGHKHSKSGKKCSCKHKLVDDHDIMNESNSNASEEEMLKAMGDLLRRTKEKTQYGYSTAPKFVQDLLKDIETRLSTIDYKRILQKAIKKTLPSFNRERTWHRPSKRYGYIAPGTKDGRVCNVHIMADSSGSISIEEMNVFLGEVDSILKNLKTNVMLHLFHTQVYQSLRFKRGYGIDKLSLQSGGTDLQNCFDIMKKQPADLLIFLTDGYYSDIKMDKKPHYQVIFCISKGGDMNHILKRLGETVQIK